jgi:ferredoxin
MKKVWIDPGCISCGTCEFVAPEVFKVTDISHIKENAPITKCAESIKEAARLCPVSVIKCEE